MAKEYIVIHDGNQKLGLIAMSKHVIESITRCSIEEEQEFVLPEPSRFHSPIACRIVDNKLNICCEVRIRYGTDVNKTCEALQHKIQQMLLQMTDLTCPCIEINVVGFVF